ncbi:hypothetical protein [Paenibacillus humicola]|uniref:hypothetical protein n=1 Tax=Paenibacillus humicola TaxID=3110540 RepID=UPI00237BB017|nr:hypothetical protein [Paenibacillus humicola]
MKVEAARDAAKSWVAENACRTEGFVGAYFSGSTVDMDGNAELPSDSDVDVIVVLDRDEAPMKPGKFRYEGVLLEATYLSANDLASPEKVLADYHLAGGFRRDTLIADPSGRLKELQTAVSRHFADSKWVRRRCGHARSRIEQGLRGLDVNAPLPDRAMAWLFPTGVTTHVLLAAATRNPTVRLRYLAARKTLERYGQSGMYPELLELLGCAQLSEGRVAQHLSRLEQTFDAAAGAAKTPFFFSSDITAAARPVAIDGIRMRIAAGDYREAVFWIAATFARCHKILAADDPAQDRALLPAFEELLDDLGVATDRELHRRADAVLRYLPKLWACAEAIIAANPEIRVSE